MKKLTLVLALCLFVTVAGCQKNSPDVPKSVSIYQKLELTAEQNQKLVDIRKAQRTRMEAIRKDMEQKRENLLDPKGTRNYTEAQKKENYEKYRQAAKEMRDKLAVEKNTYDSDLMNILDDKQKKTYQKYIDQREKERAAREKEFNKGAAKK